MKPSTIALAVVLFVASSSDADNKTTPKTNPKLKRRGLQGGDMPMSTESSDASPNSFGNWCTDGFPRQNVCTGSSHYRILRAADVVTSDVLPLPTNIAWSTFFAATPPNCVMAPVHTYDEWDTLLAEAAALNINIDNKQKANVWVGIFKPATDVGPNPNPSGAIITPSKTGWFNLDGTYAAVDRPTTNQWEDDEPNNTAPGYQTRAHMKFSASDPDERGLLRDAADLNGAPEALIGTSVSAAIYQCCDEEVATFPTCQSY